MAQGYEPEDACLIGVFLHGSAGDITAQDLGQDAMRPSDLVGALSTAWKRLRGVSEQALQ
jgi:NAD(P)H-hydrate epimerase